MAKKKRLLWQLYPSYLLITILSLVAVTWYASTSLKQVYLEQTATDLEVRAHLFKTQIMELLNPLNEKGLDLLCKKIGHGASTRITVILPSGRVIGDSEEDPAKMDTHVDRPEFLEALSGSPGVSTRLSLTVKRNLMYVGIPIKKDGKILAVVRTATPVDPIDTTITQIQTRIALAGLIIALFAAVVSLLVSRRITRPIEQVKKWAEHIARGQFQFRPSVGESEEMEALSEAMKQMSLELRNRIDTVLRQRNEIETMLSSMVEGVIAVDTDERVISMNDAAAKMFGCDPKEAQGRSIQEMARNSVLQEFVTTTLSSKEPVEKDIALASNGEKFVKTHGTQLRDAEGWQIGALIVLDDITHLRKLENIRRDFVANVSHEIKTPITAIKGFVETLRDGAVNNPEDSERFLGIISKHVDRLEAIIEDLLSLSRIEQEAERAEFPLTERRIHTALNTAVQICEKRALSKKIQVDMLCPQDMTAMINPPLLEQAIVNLLDNGIKYSHENSRVQLIASDSNGEIMIRVSDQGRGIDKKHLPRLFERFYRVDKARSRREGGTGLGLAIVKHIVQAHNGRLEVESTPGKGSRFSIYLPKKDTNLTPEPSA